MFLPVVADQGLTREERTMKRKLTATHFEYELEDEYGNVKTYNGSRLAVGVSSYRSLRRFVNGNIRRNGSTLRLRGLRPTRSHITEWITK